MQKFIKSYWFPMAILVILGMAFLRKNFQVDIHANPPRTVKKPEKLTELASTAPALQEMSLVSGNGQESIPFIDEARARTFLERFKKTAQMEGKKFSIPPSVILACAFINSYGGERREVVALNNYFSMPQSSGSKRFKRYGTAWESFRDFSATLAGQKWLPELKQKAGNDAEKWLQLLGETGISDVPNFSDEAAKVWQLYSLGQLD